MNARVLFALALVLLPAAAAAQSPGHEPVPPVDRVRALVEALESGDPEHHRRFVEAHYAPSLREARPMEEHLRALARLHADVGAVADVSVERTGPAEVAVTLAAAGSGDRYRVLVGFEEGPPGRIASMRVARAPMEEAPFATLEELDLHLESEAAADRFSGVVLVARGGVPVLERAYGWADRAEGRRNRVDTRFNIGSLNKQFTAVAVLQLVEDGRLGLDDVVGKYLTGFPPEVAGRVTVRHLLQHRSGWGHYWDHPYYLAHRDELRTVDDYMAFIREVPLEFEPGTSERYSNIGYDVLGAVVESVTGEDYYEYVRRRIFEPAGMADTDSYEKGSGVENLAVGYTRVGDGPPDAPLRENTPGLRRRGTPAGGGYSTAGDLLRFYTALREGRLLERPSVSLLLSGFEDAETDAPGGIGAAGGAPGINADVEVDLASGDVVVVLANLDPPVAEETAKAIYRMLHPRPGR